MAYHYIRELIDNDTLTLIHVSTADNTVDICTKALPLLRFTYLQQLTLGNN